MLGESLLERLEVVNHDCRDPDHVDLGLVSGDVRVALDHRWVEADVRVSTGFVEPHFFAGFSGGPKLVAPGLAALHTVEALHNAARIGSPQAVWGVVEGNPVHDAIREAAALAPPTLSFDVLLNRHHEITHAFAGDLDATHAEACRTARSVAMRAVPHRYPVVVTTNAGFPLDQNLYQAVKGMRSAAQVVAPGGLVICAAECSDGVPSPSPFADQVLSGLAPEELLRRIRGGEEAVPEQWQVQILADMLADHRIGVHCTGIADDDLRLAGLLPVADVGEAVELALADAGPGPVCACCPRVRRPSRSWKSRADDACHRGVRRAAPDRLRRHDRRRDGRSRRGGGRGRGAGLPHSPDPGHPGAAGPRDRAVPRADGRPLRREPHAHAESPVPFSTTSTATPSSGPGSVSSRPPGTTRSATSARSRQPASRSSTRPRRCSAPWRPRRWASMRSPSTDSRRQGTRATTSWQAWC